MAIVISATAAAQHEQRLVEVRGHLHAGGLHTRLVSRVRVVMLGGVPREHLEPELEVFGANGRLAIVVVERGGFRVTLPDGWALVSDAPTAAGVITRRR